MQKALNAIGMMPAVVRLRRSILGHRPVPVRHGHVGAVILQRLLEFVEIDAVPRQEALPAVLAVVLVDQRQIVVAAAVFRPFVELVQLAHRKAQLLQLRLVHAVEIHALLQFAALKQILVGGAAVWPILYLLQLNDGADNHASRLRRLQSDQSIVAELVIIGRATIVYPVANKLHILCRDRPA